MLHKPIRIPVSSYSKGSRGLSVLLRVPHSVFKLLSTWLRQRGSRYAIRAGRNLPDKEFRYLRTVILRPPFTASGSFARRLTPFNLPAPGRRHTTYFILRFCVVLFLKQSLPPGLCNQTMLQE